MDAAAVLREYDGMRGARPTGELERFLDESIARARAEHDRAALLTLVNEAVGLARNLRKRDKTLALCDELLPLAGELCPHGEAQYATVLLNAATAYSVFGKYAGAEALFREAEAALRQCAGEHGYELASLYNNWSMLYVQQGRFAESVSLQKDALARIDAMDGMAAEKATSRANIASILLRRYEAEGTPELLDEAERLLGEALELFQTEARGTFHGGTARITLGDLRMARRDYAGAAEAYAGAMAELERTIGRTAQYETARTLCERARKAAETA